MEVKPKVYIGMDPGKMGAIALIYPNGVVTTKAYPLIGKEYDLLRFKEMFLEWKEDPHFSYHIVIEDVKALQGSMKAGNWSLSRGKTILEVMSAAYDIPNTLVHSKTWQKEMWQGVPEQRGPSTTKVVKGKKVSVKGSVNTKAMSMIAAQRLFPTVDLRDPARKTDRGTKLHDGACDAVLMAEYGRRKNY